MLTKVVPVFCPLSDIGSMKSFWKMVGVLFITAFIEHCLGDSYFSKEWAVKASRHDILFLQGSWEQRTRQLQVSHSHQWVLTVAELHGQTWSLSWFLRNNKL